MKNIGLVIFVVLILVILGLAFASFQVRQTEAALVMTFQKPPASPITEPGWYFKWPPPIQWVYKFDTRLRVLEAELRETQTKGAVPIIVSTYVVWRIADPLQFYKAVETVARAEEKLLSQINDTQGRVIGRYSFSQFVNSDPNEIRFKEIQAEMLEDLKGHYLNRIPIA